MDTKTEYELEVLKNPPKVALSRDGSSCIDVGIQSFVGVNSIVVYIRPNSAKRTKHHTGAGNLETRTFQELEVNELRGLFLKELGKEEVPKFQFQTPVPTYGYIFDLKHKHRIYEIVKEIEE